MATQRGSAAHRVLQFLSHRGQASTSEIMEVDWWAFRQTGCMRRLQIQGLVEKVGRGQWAITELGKIELHYAKDGITMDKNRRQSLHRALDAVMDAATKKTVNYAEEARKCLEDFKRRKIDIFDDIESDIIEYAMKHKLDDEELYKRIKPIISRMTGVWGQH